jgi:hypothetical protein
MSAPWHIAQSDVCADTPVPLDSSLSGRIQLYFECHTTLRASGHLRMLDLIAIGTNLARLRHSERDQPSRFPSRSARKNLKRGALLYRLYWKPDLRLCLYIYHATNLRAACDGSRARGVVRHQSVASRPPPMRGPNLRLSYGVSGQEAAPITPSPSSGFGPPIAINSSPSGPASKARTTSGATRSTSHWRNS